MAIAQSRVIKLIDSGNDYRKSLESLCRTIHAQLRQAERNLQDPLFCLQFLASQANPEFLLRDYVGSRVTLEREHLHFSKNMKRNERRAHEAAKQRIESGIIPRNVHYNPAKPLHPEPKYPETSPEIQVAEDDRALAQSAWQDPELARQIAEAERKKDEAKAFEEGWTDEPNNETPDEEVS